MKNKPNRAFKDTRNAPKKGRPEPKQNDAMTQKKKYPKTKTS